MNNINAKNYIDKPSLFLFSKTTFVNLCPSVLKGSLSLNALHRGILQTLPHDLWRLNLACLACVLELDCLFDAASACFAAFVVG